MKYLYAPWRDKYVQEQVYGKQEATSSRECALCNCTKEDNVHCYILYRASSWFIMMNRFPYNAGHLLIVSYSHIPTLTTVSQEARHELSDLTHICIEILQKALEPQGFNIGLNIGKAAGAGIPSHIHQHVLPRWSGDTNFLPVLAETKHISCDLNKMYKRLVGYFDKIDK